MFLVHITPQRFSLMLLRRLEAWLILQRTGLVLLLLGVWMASGCASGAVLAKNMPPQWQAVSVSNAQTVDLTKLASPTMPQDQIVQGDVLKIDISSGFGRQENSSQTSRVDDHGQIVLPYVGPVTVAGLKLVEAEQAVRQATIDRELFRDPSITVTMSSPKVNRVTVLGAVNKQGLVELRPGSSDLLQAITVAGGLAKEAGTEVEILHPGFQPGAAPNRSPAVASDLEEGIRTASGELPVKPVGAQSIKVNLASLGKDGSGIPTVTDGTVVWVEKQDPLPLKVDGLVSKPAHYDYPVGKNLQVLDAISMAGGTSSLIADKIFVIRQVAGQPEPALIQVSYRKAKRDGHENILLQPGDIVSVEQTPATVILEGIKSATIGVTGRAF